MNMRLEKRSRAWDLDAPSSAEVNVMSCKTGRRIGVCLVTAVSLLGFAIPAHTATFEDSTFPNSDWDSIKIVDTTGNDAFFDAYQQATGGNPDEYRYVRQEYTLGTIMVAHLNDHTIYDPSMEGALETVDFSYDLIHLDPPPGQAMAFSLVLLQDGSYYGGPWDDIYAELWTIFEHEDLVATDFTLRAGDGPPHPDFSSGGPPINLGYVTANSSTGGLVMREGGIDNWTVTLHPSSTGVDEYHKSEPWGLTKMVYLNSDR
jgi:hypothetical protein